jgi:hypothetical protein
MSSFKLRFPVSTVIPVSSFNIPHSTFAVPELPFFVLLALFVVNIVFRCSVRSVPLLSKIPLIAENNPKNRAIMPF